MAYNPYPVNYPYFPQQQYNQSAIQPIQPPQQTQQQGNLIWVQGIEGAKSYLVAPNSTVQLWDSEAESIYLKSADATGMPSIKILDYTVRNAQNTPKKPPIEEQTIKYATKDDIDGLRAEFAKKLEDIKGDLGV